MSEYNDIGTNGWDRRMDEAPASAAEPAADGEALEIEEFVPRRRDFDTRLDVEVVRVDRDDFDVDITGGDARKARREVVVERTESRDDDAETEAAAPERAAAEDEQAETEQPVRGQRFKLIRQLILGTILNADSVREHYRYAILVAVMLFLSIVMLFSSLGTYLRYTKLEDEVHLLRERAIRMSEQRYENSSHSAIVRRLKERGINLKDPQEPHELLK